VIEEESAAAAEAAAIGGFAPRDARDAFTPEVESDRSIAIYGESNRLPSTEVRYDPDGEPDDPMAGDPNLSADRGPTGPESG
jgi:hypothetical protein